MTKKLNGAVQGSEEYWYDGDNRRYLTVKRNSAGTKTDAIWFIRDTEAHYDAAGTVTRAFGHVSMGTPVARTDRSSDGPSTLEYQFHGLANNTIATVDQVSGTINASFTYAPFGEVIEATNGGEGSNGLAMHKRRFNDKFIDEVSGLAYYGFRYYDRLSLTWTQGDPLYRFVPELAGARTRRSNLYGFSRNNPLRYLDPDGLDDRPLPIDCGIAPGPCVPGPGGMPGHNPADITINATPLPTSFLNSRPRTPWRAITIVGAGVAALFGQWHISTLLLLAPAENDGQVAVAMVTGGCAAARSSKGAGCSAGTGGAAISFKEAMKRSIYKPTQTMRRMDLDKVDEYAAMMESGTWKWSTTEKVIIDSENAIVSGHHRIMAATKAGVDIPEDAIYRMARPSGRPVYTWDEVLPD